MVYFANLLAFVSLFVVHQFVLKLYHGRVGKEDLEVMKYHLYYQTIVDITGMFQ